MACGVTGQGEPDQAPHHGRLAQLAVHVGALPAIIDDEEARRRAARDQAAQALVQPCRPFHPNTSLLQQMRNAVQTL